MKARLYTSVSLGLAFSALPFAAGCTQQSADQPASLISSANAEPVIAATDSNAPATTPSPSAVAETPTTETVALPAPALDSEKKLPANIRPSTPAGEVIKLVQAGVDETVMLNYITNSGSMFSLSSDDIIYLNDLGVADTVVTAMMQHDQGLKGAWSQPASQSPQVAAQPLPAAAPAYVNPPQSEPQPTAAETATPPAANVTYFYDSLAPYGTWVEVEGYGRCWQPTVVVVNRGWRPYSDRGHWVYTDSGWYWMSDYSWGWAPFHYGRWLDHPRWGWCWWPDRVWAPSWVSWRYSGDYCGWAPLPPAAYYRPGFGFSYYGRSVGLSFDFGLGANCFTFVSWNHFRDSRPWHHRVGSHQVNQIYNHTTIVNHYGTGHNNTVINHGIPADRVREHTRTELRPVSIRDHTETAGRGGRGERLERDGRSVLVNRPRIPESAAARPLMTPPPRIETTTRNGSVAGGDARALNERNRPQERNRGAEEARVRAQGAATPAAPPTPQTLTRTPVVTAASPQATRGTGSERNAEAARERASRPANPTPPPATAPAPRPPVVAPAPTTPPQNENRGTPRPQENRGANPNRERTRNGSQTTTAAPLIVTGSGNANRTQASPTPVPPNSIVVIGRRDASANREPRPENTPRAATARPAQNWTAPTTAAPVRQYADNERVQQSFAPSYTPPAAQPTRVMREQNRYTQPRPSAPAPVYVVPTPVPVQRSYPSAPAYRAPQPTPAPSYAPAPARSQNTESRSTPERSSSGGRDNGRSRQSR